MTRSIIKSKKWIIVTLSVIIIKCSLSTKRNTRLPVCFSLSPRNKCHSARLIPQNNFFYFFSTLVSLSPSQWKNNRRSFIPTITALPKNNTNLALLQHGRRASRFVLKNYLWAVGYLVVCLCTDRARVNSLRITYSPAAYPNAI